MEHPGHLLVDGYNILHAWRWIRDGAPAAAVDAARERLAEALRVVHDVDGWAVTLVFDGRGSAHGCDKARSEPGFAVMFTAADRTADDMIESLVAAAPNPRICSVATADRLERETVFAAGASCISPDELHSWIERSHRRAAQAATRRRQRDSRDWGTKLPL